LLPHYRPVYMPTSCIPTIVSCVLIAHHAIAGNRSIRAVIAQRIPPHPSFTR
jgi:hypothetical protein